MQSKIHPGLGILLTGLVTAYFFYAQSFLFGLIMLVWLLKQIYAAKNPKIISNQEQVDSPKSASLTFYIMGSIQAACFLLSVYTAIYPTPTLGGAFIDIFVFMIVAISSVITGVVSSRVRKVNPKLGRILLVLAFLPLIFFTLFQLVFFYKNLCIGASCPTYY